MEVLAISNYINVGLEKKAECIPFAKTIKYTHIQFFERKLKKEKKVNSLLEHKYPLLFLLLMKDENYAIS